jgi:glycosyltransferase involved in cell wall biosynthesis
MPEPTVSIICATYNRAEVLRYAIRSVLASTFSDWELIVVGDGCTDHTANVVESFGDPRLSFENLPDNSGGQAAPNNRGLAKARGRYVFFLNHDDMYLPDHIATAVAFLETTQADLIWHPVLLLKRSGAATGPPHPTHDLLGLEGAVGPEGYDPHGFYIASSWAMRRAFAAAVGQWRREDAIRISPSQDWLFRASQSTRRMIYHPKPSVLCIHGGARRLSYRVSTSPEHERAFSWISGGPQALRSVYECLAINQSQEMHRRALRKRKRAVFRGIVGAISARLGIHPVEMQRLREGMGKGEWIDSIRRRTIQPATLRPGVVVKANSTEADEYLVEGWSIDKPVGRATRTRACVQFWLDTPSSPVSLRLHFSGPDRSMTIIVDGAPVMTRRLLCEENVLVPLGWRQGAVRVDVQVEPRVPNEEPVDISLIEFELIADGLFDLRSQNPDG